MMMQSLNSGITGKMFKFALLALMIGAGIGLVMTDIGGYFRGGGVSRSDVARVGSEKIGLVDFSASFRRTLTQNNIPEAEALQMGMPYMVLQQEITDRVLRQAAKQSGIRVSDAHVARELKRQLANIELPGSAKDKLQAVLQQQGTTEQAFVEMLRTNFAVNLMASAIATSDQQIPEVFADRAYRYDRQKRSAQIIQISENTLKTKPTLDDAALQSYYKENTARYRVPEKRDLAFVVFKQSALMPDVTVSEAQAQNYYKEHSSQFMNPERVRLSQWVTRDEKTAKEILTKKPATLDGFKKDGVEALTADWYSRPMLNKVMQDALYPSQKTGLVGPLKTDLGWHVLLVEKYEAATAKNFADVKDIILRELKDRQVDEKLNGVTEQIETLASSSSSLDPIAQEYKLSVQKVSDLTPEKFADKLKAAGIHDAIAVRLGEAAFTLGESEISPIMDSKDGDMILAQVTKLIPSTTSDFAAVKERIRVDATQAAVREAVDNLGTKAVRVFDTTKPQEWASKVTTLGLSPRSLEGLDRTAAIKALGNEASNLLFTMTLDSPISSVPNDKGILVVKLQQIIPYEGAADNGSLTHASTRLKSEMAQEVQQEFVAGWRNRMGVSVNDALMQQYFAPKSE